MIIDCISFALPCTLWALVNEYDMTTCLVVKTFFNCFSETLKAGVTLNIIFPPLNGNISFTFKAIQKLFAHNMNLCYGVFYKFWADF